MHDSTMTDPPALAAALATRAEQVCRHYLPRGRLQGRYWTVGDVLGTPGRSLYVRLSPPGAPGRWTDARHGRTRRPARARAAQPRRSDAAPRARRGTPIPRPARARRGAAARHTARRGRAADVADVPRHRRLARRGLPARARYPRRPRPGAAVPPHPVLPRRRGRVPRVSGSRRASARCRWKFLRDSAHVPPPRIPRQGAGRRPAEGARAHPRPRGAPRPAPRTARSPSPRGSKPRSRCAPLARPLPLPPHSAPPRSPHSSRPPVSPESSSPATTTPRATPPPSGSRRAATHSVSAPGCSCHCATTSTTTCSTTVPPRLPNASWRRFADEHRHRRDACSGDSHALAPDDNTGEAFAALSQACAEGCRLSRARHRIRTDTANP